MFNADADIDQAAPRRAHPLSSTQDVGYSAPNKYGLYDTLGNVWEWCLDTVDDQGDHSLRGGSWLSSADNFPQPTPACRRAEECRQVHRLPRGADSELITRRRAAIKAGRNT